MCSPSPSWIAVIELQLDATAANPLLWLAWVLAAGYELWLIPCHGWLEMRRMDTSFGWFYPVGAWVLGARYEFQLIPYCTWLQAVRDSASWIKYIVLMVCFLPAGFNYYWFNLWLLPQESWRTLRKLQNSSCNWFYLQRLIWAAAADSRPTTDQLPLEFWPRWSLICNKHNFKSYDEKVLGAVTSDKETRKKIFESTFYISNLG